MDSMDRLKYFLCFAAALVSAFVTYRAFSMFKADAVFSASLPFVNTVVLMLIWAISFSAKSEFVRRNKMLLIAIPLTSIHISNLVTHVNHPSTSATGFVLYVTASSSLVFFSYQSSVLESRID